MLSNFANPYTGQTFFGFFAVLLKRLAGLVTGTLEANQLFSDEIQLLCLGSIAISCALVGIFLVLRKKTMVANALSHTILLGIVIAFLVMRIFQGAQSDHLMSTPILLFAAMVAALLTTFCSEFLIQKVRLQEDVSIGIIFTLFFAVGVVLLTLFARSAHLGTEIVMGSVDALQQKDIAPSFKICLINLVIILFFFKEFKVSAFDSSFARIIGVGPLFFHYLLMVQTSVVSMISFQAIGVVMVLAFFVAPVMIMRLLTDRLLPLLFGSIAISLASCLFGLALSRHILTIYQVGLSTGAMIVSSLFFFYLLLFAIKGKRLTISDQHSTI